MPEPSANANVIDNVKVMLKTDGSGWNVVVKVIPLRTHLDIQYDGDHNKPISIIYKCSDCVFWTNDVNVMSQHQATPNFIHRVKRRLSK